MDTSDPEITFDVNGVCIHCTNFYNFTSKDWLPTPEGKMQLEGIVEKIKKQNKSNQKNV
jgi:hypothetical protein